MRKLIIVFAILAFAVGVASARQMLDEPRGVREAGRVNWFWFDDLEGGTAGWTHGDYTATSVPHFHVDTYLAYSGTYSWWCGNFDYDANGGYGNNWDDRLTCPSTDWTGYTYPVVSMYYRNCTEPTYDFTYVQAESSGAYVNLNRGFDGTHPWGATGFYLGNKDNPAQVRFRFVADGAWSDEDGDDTDGGACHFDEIMIWDYYTGTVLFYDDVETGGLCTPGVPAAAGDYWHVVQDYCAAFSVPTCFVSTAIDTPGFTAPNVQNWLRTPTVDFSSAVSCTVYWVYQLFFPDPSCYWYEVMVFDGVETVLHGYYGDQCDSGYGPCDHFGGIQDDVSSLLPASTGYFEWVIFGSDTGCGPNSCGNSGLAIDDVGWYGQEVTPVEESSWGRVKSLYR